MTPFSVCACARVTSSACQACPLVRLNDATFRTEVATLIFQKLLPEVKFGQCPEDVKGWHPDKWIPILKAVQGKLDNVWQNWSDPQVLQARVPVSGALPHFLDS